MTDERAMRFGYLLSEIEVGARKLLNGGVQDIQLGLIQIRIALDEAWEIAGEVSREALDKVVGPTTIKLKEPLPADTEIKDVLPP